MIALHWLWEFHRMPPRSPKTPLFRCRMVWWYQSYFDHWLLTIDQFFHLKQEDLHGKPQGP